MLTAVTIEKGVRKLVFSGGAKFSLVEAMDAELVNSDVALIDVDVKRKIYLHDNDAHGVDVHIRYDGKLPPDKWWEQGPGDPIDPKLPEVPYG